MNGAVLIDIHDTWIASDRRYLSIESKAPANTTLVFDAGRRLTVPTSNSSAPSATARTPETLNGAADAATIGLVFEARGIL